VTRLGTLGGQAFQGDGPPIVSGRENLQPNWIKEKAKVLCNGAIVAQKYLHTLGLIKIFFN
jgi:hypothetical protein